MGKKRRVSPGVIRLVSFGSGRPAYLQLADTMRQLILDGTLAPGDKLPSATDLTRQYDVSRQVAVMALRELHHAGLIYGHPGKGTFVRERPVLRRRSTTWYAGGRGAGSPTARSVEAQGGTASREHASHADVATAEIAARLEIDEGDPVMITRYTYLADGVPIQLATSWEPLGSPAARRSNGRKARTYRRRRRRPVRRHRHRITTVDEVVTSRLPTLEEQQILGVATGVPMICVQRTYAADGRPVETADISAPATGTNCTSASP